MREPARIEVIRVTRPYDSEKEFIEGDEEWLGVSTFVLPSVPERERGELVRFEILLASGAPVFRAEGRVVGFHASGSTKPPGLEVRFTRIDARSKLLLDAIRERRDSQGEGSGVRLQPRARIVAPSNRDEILDQLRARAKVLAAAGGFSFKKS